MVHVDPFSDAKRLRLWVTSCVMERALDEKGAGNEGKYKPCSPKAGTP